METPGDDYTFPDASDTQGGDSTTAGFGFLKDDLNESGEESADGDEEVSEEQRKIQDAITSLEKIMAANPCDALVEALSSLNERLTGGGKP